MIADVVIVGAGPAGVRAAEVLVDAGLRPIVLDEAARPGGQIYRQPPVGAERDGNVLYGSEADKAKKVHAVFEKLGHRVDYRPNSLVWNCFQGKLNVISKGEQDVVGFDRLLLATGAFDRIIPFPGWTLPGVFTLGAAQIALKAQAVSIGKRVVLVGAGPLLPLVASQYLDAGVNVAAVLDASSFANKVKALPGMMALPGYVRRGLSYLRTIKRHAVQMAYGIKALQVIGDTQVEGLKWLDKSGRWNMVECDAVGASFGLKPETQLADLAGCSMRFDELTRQWVPVVRAGGRSSVDGVYLAGDCSDIGGADVAELAGRRAGYSILEDLGRSFDSARLGQIETELERHRRFRRAIEEAYPFPSHLVDNMPDSLMICRCEGVTAGELRANYVKSKAPEVNRLKAFTRVGMGRCQGRVCGAMAAEVLSEKNGKPLPEVGHLRGQHPVKPIPMTV